MLLYKVLADYASASHTHTTINNAMAIDAPIANSGNILTLYGNYKLMSAKTQTVIKMFMVIIVMIPEIYVATLKYMIKNVN